MHLFFFFSLPFLNLRGGIPQTFSEKRKSIGHVEHIVKTVNRYRFREATQKQPRNLEADLPVGVTQLSSIFSDVGMETVE